VNWELIGAWGGFVLTLLVFSYLLGDNLLYRLAVHVFIGMTAAYLTVVIVESVILPFARSTFGTLALGGILFGMLPVLLAVLLLLKSRPRIGGIGNVGMAFVVGVGAAVALVGAVGGTLIPLFIETSVGAPDPVDTVIILLGVVCTLLYFNYLARRQPNGEVRRGRVLGILYIIGEGFIAVTLGALYAAAILSSLTIFSERVGFLVARIMGG
jgi:hypothetical protein